MATTYHMTHKEMRDVLHDAIGAYVKLRTTSGVLAAADAAVNQTLAALTTDQELAATDPTDYLQLLGYAGGWDAAQQLLASADASAESYEANSKALSS